METLKRNYSTTAAETIKQLVEALEVARYVANHLADKHNDPQPSTTIAAWDVAIAQGRKMLK